ncbi:flagellar hook-associated protein FlgK [Colwellia sp. 1_MG-2023]|jgi:flagellar hook-associated protein 1 FlgK|uniref:flagellar hook-associated protein FlgK n=1 Tax=unclassified Colwellia TaxID=196834 RepID=UPI001C0A6447|nr:MULTISPECIES: flagellar hook-associated protein FlgK [unclassified Colwellia]MBU2923260.1 flagellar hook-associated protein FlgK [Colwellia sp. C2M11]MDO6654019.1 flagellar hook-associated protein FlgK [Colwellia sp. 3_MG-2023]MDO6666967.1 flagellar hook-associated protein FlgK [Colwellia sp. 2_MG-2023]MDO6691339.1 flagellar hook-associated protein FlgK [Colwellia sp. 1_MG-2023]
MSVSLYQSGVSGLSAAQQQLATTSNNIANVNTEGYNRQRAEQNASMGLVTGGNYIGTGTYVQDITRVYDEFSYKEQTLSQSNLSNADLFDRRLTQLDQIMNTGGGAVVTSLENFYQAVNSIADNPGDAGLRSIVLNQANILSNDFNELSNTFDKMTDAVNGEIAQVATRISEISYELAKLNETMAHSQGVSGQPNDLLDKRDQLITELSSYTNVSTIEDQYGVQTVMIGQGTTLVAGITPFTLEVTVGDPDVKQTQINLVRGDSSVSLDAQKLGGSLGANFEFRDEDLREIGVEIDRLAMAISSTLNDTQASGLDLNGLQGANMFTDINTTQLQQSRVLSPSSNTGTTSAQVTINDVSLVTTDEFEVRFDGTDFTIHNLTTGGSENLGPPGGGTPAGTHTPTNPDYGFSFVETGTPVAGDVFIIEPTRNSAALMQTTLTDGTGIAASSAVAVTASTNNVSDGTIAITNVIDPEVARTYDVTVDVYESTPGTFSYRVYDSSTPPPAPTIASGSYVAGASATVDIPSGSPVFQIEITGDLAGEGVNARETFTIGDAFGVGNATHALAMAKTQEEGVTDGGEETFSQSLATSTAVVGAKASNAELVADTAQALYTQAYNRNQATSGVNLDEEAANLLKFQQAYQAASQIITTANTIFDTILAAVR